MFRSPDVDIIVETSEVEELKWKGERDPWCNLQRMRWSGSRRRSDTCPDWNAIRKHRTQEWGTAIYRIVNDVGKTARHALEMYESTMVEQSATWPEYKEKTNAQSWGCLMQAELLGPLNNSRDKIGNRVRERLLEFREGRL